MILLGLRVCSFASDRGFGYCKWLLRTAFTYLLFLLMMSSQCIFQLDEHSVFGISESNHRLVKMYFLWETKRKEKKTDSKYERVIPSHKRPVQHSRSGSGFHQSCKDEKKKINKWIKGKLAASALNICLASCCFVGIFNCCLRVCILKLEYLLHQPRIGTPSTFNYATTQPSFKLRCLPSRVNVLQNLGVFGYFSTRKTSLK